MLRVHEGGGSAVRGLNLGPDAFAEGVELLTGNLAKRPPHAVDLLEVFEDALTEVCDKARHGNPRAEGREDAPRVMVAVVHPCLVMVRGMSHRLLLTLEDGDIVPASREEPGNIEAEDAASDDCDSLFGQFSSLTVKPRSQPLSKKSPLIPVCHSLLLMHQYENICVILAQ